MGDARFDHLAAYYAASPERRVEMIHEALEEQKAARLSAYIDAFERRHGVGSYAEHRAEVERLPMPDHLAVDLGFNTQGGMVHGASRGGVWS